MRKKDRPFSAGHQLDFKIRTHVPPKMSAGPMPSDPAPAVVVATLQGTLSFRIPSLIEFQTYQISENLSSLFFKNFTPIVNRTCDVRGVLQGFDVMIDALADSANLVPSVGAVFAVHNPPEF